MTRQETEDYYKAIGSDSRTVFIDSLYEKQEIISAITNAVQRNGNETIYIETFHMNENIASYSLTLSPADNSYSLWEKHTMKLKNANMDKIAQQIYDELPVHETSPYRLYIAGWNENHKSVIVKSFDDKQWQDKINKNDPDEYMDKHVLGQYMLPNGDIEYHTIGSEDISLLQNACEQIHDRDIRIFTKTALLVRQDYINKRPYNKEQEESLYMHILRADKILNILTGTHYARIKFQQHEVDMMRSAVLLSDILKYGWDDTNDENCVAKHPSVTADVIRSIPGIIKADEMNSIANCIESHSYEKELGGHIPPKIPDTEYKYAVQLAHMIADETARK